MDRQLQKEGLVTIALCHKAVKRQPCKPTGTIRQMAAAEADAAFLCTHRIIKQRPRQEEREKWCLMATQSFFSQRMHLIGSLPVGWNVHLKSIMGPS